MVNELVEAKQHNQVKRAMAKWMKYELIVLDQLGYVPLADIAAEFFSQVISERAERATWIGPTSLRPGRSRTVFAERWRRKRSGARQSRNIETKRT